MIAIVNAAALERSLYLIAELLALDVPLVVGLNMSDVAEQHGIHVEPHVLSAALGLPVVSLVAAKNIGVHELVDEALKLAAAPDAVPPQPTDHPPRTSAGARSLASHDRRPRSRALPRGLGSTETTGRRCRDHRPGRSSGRRRRCGSRRTACCSQHEDAYLDIAGGRYEWVGRMVRAAVTQPKAGVVTRTERIDRVATHPFWGLFLLLAMFGTVFWLTYTIATPIANWLATWVLGTLDAIAAATLSWAPPWLYGVISDGLIHGVGAVFTFLPILVIFFAALGMLEDVGYLARGAYVMDRFMHLMGLHGKSFMPLFLGFGCNVPAVLGARIIEDRRARLLTILLAPLVPCTARLAVIAFLTPAFFPAHAALVSWGLVALSLLVLAVAGIIVNKLAFQGEHTAFIMELPLYHVPNARTIGLYVKNNTVSFIKKAGTLILIASMVVWALSTIPGRGIEQSVLATFGRALEPLGQLMGLGQWQLIVALITSFFAKENTIATLGVLYGGETAGALAAPGGVRAGPRSAAGLPGGADALHPVPGNRSDDQGRDAVVALDAAQHRDDVGDIAGRGDHRVSARGQTIK